MLQIDDPALVDLYDWWFSRNDDMAGFRKWAAFQVEALNHALEGIPEDRVRYPHLLGQLARPAQHRRPAEGRRRPAAQVKAQAYSVEAGNVRHEHEWKVWRDIQAAGGQDAHPRRRQPRHQRARAPRARRRPDLQYASVVGRENVIAGTDCGLGGRVHPQLAWAKLRALSEGAALASKQLWT